MDCRSTRRFLATSRVPLGEIGFTLLQHYVADAREDAKALGLEVTVLENSSRCRARSGCGHCTNAVCRAALTQHCWKHQSGRSLAAPVDLQIECVLRGRVQSVHFYLDKSLRRQ